MVKGTFDEGTAKIFKCLQKNTLTFRGDALNHLRSAAEISAARAQFTPSVRPRGSFNPRYQRGRGRGDPYRSYQRPYIPAQRPPNPSPQGASFQDD